LVASPETLAVLAEIRDIFAWLVDANADEPRLRADALGVARQQPPAMDEDDGL
jgi:hypothetical protein